MAAPLAHPSDVEDVWRPIADDERPRIFSLIAKASALLRQIVPAVDDRIGLFATDPTSPRALDPVLVADVVATAVKNFINNPDGVATKTESVGPYSQSVSFLARGEKSNPAGQLMFTQELLDRLQPGQSMSELYGSIRTRPDGWKPQTWDADQKPGDGTVWDEFYRQHRYGGRL
jgi:hypothetical protein